MVPAIDALVNAILDQDAISGGRHVPAWVADAINKVKNDAQAAFLTVVQDAVNASKPS